MHTRCFIKVTFIRSVESIYGCYWMSWKVIGMVWCCLLCSQSHYSSPVCYLHNGAWEKKILTQQRGHMFPIKFSIFDKDAYFFGIQKLFLSVPKIPTYTGKQWPFIFWMCSFFLTMCQFSLLWQTYKVVHGRVKTAICIKGSTLAVSTVIQGRV